MTGRGGASRSDGSDRANGPGGGDGAVRPMDGVRVLDIATFLAAPFCGTLLAEFGAEVIKIEQPGVGDPLRRFGTASASDTGDTLIWLQESRNKKSITLDLRKPEGAELLKRLVAESDVLVENFRTGTLERWGVGWETLREVNPKLVMVRITGFGQTGPKAARSGVRPDRPRLQRAELPRGRARGGAPHAGLDDPRRLSRRHLWRDGRAHGPAGGGADRRGPVHRHRALRAGLPLPRRDGGRLRPQRLRARADGGRTR